MRRRGSIRKRCKCARSAWSRCEHAWTVTVTKSYDARGRAEQESEAVRGSRDDAEARLREMLEHVYVGGVSARMPLDAYLRDRWLLHAETRVRPRTLVRYEQLLRIHVIPQIGKVALRKLTPTDVQSVVDRMIAGGLSARSTEQAYRVLSAALRQAVRWQLIATNPAAAVQPPRVHRPDLVTPDPDALRRLMAIAKGNTVFYVPTVLAATTGMRRGEVLAMRWGDLDLDERVVRVSRSLQRIGGDLQSVEPKTARGRRTVALPGFTVDVLRNHRREQSERRLLLGEAWSDHGLVCERGDGAPLDPDAFSHAVQRLGGKIGLPHLRLHDLRHGYASALLSRGVHPKIASEALGHASVAFTLDRYSHVFPGLGRVAADAIDEALGS